MKATIPFIGIAFVFLLSCNPPDTPEPVFLRIEPQSCAPGSDFTVTGQNLHYVMKVMLDEYPLKFLVKGNDTLIAKVTRDIPLGSYMLYATFKDGKSKALPFTVIPRKPSIEKIYPLSAYTGDTLEITGYSFDDNGLEVHIADLVTKQFLKVTDTLIRLMVIKDFKSGDLTVVNSKGTSNSKFFNYLGDVANPKPIVLSINPYKSFPLGDIRITGKNFKKEKLHIVFPPQIELTENDGFFVLSDTLLEITIPKEGTTGIISIDNVYGTVYTNIVVMRTPVLTRILPAGNKAGGPMLIYGKYLDQVKSLRFGDNPLINQFGYFTTNENEEIIALQVPKMTPGNMQVRAEINDALFSNALPYKLYQGEMSLPEYMPSIVIPNTPSTNIADGINNQWIIMNKQPANLLLSQDSNDPLVIIGNGEEIGSINVEDNSIILNKAYGKLDKSYFTPEKEISRLILTPLDSGNQFEMVTPFYLESLEPLSLRPGDSLSVKGRYFVDDGFWSLSIFDNNGYSLFIESADAIVRVISSNLIKIRLPEDIPPGEYILQVNIGDSNTRKFTVVSK